MQEATKLTKMKYDYKSFHEFSKESTSTTSNLASEVCLLPTYYKETIVNTMHTLRMTKIESLEK